jgi:hypothetical protein
MAIIKLGPIVQSISGALGALTFARHKNQPIVRTTPTRVQTSSPAAMTQRAMQSAAVSAWRDLTDAQRSTWVNAVKGQTMVSPGGAVLPLDPRMFFVRQFLFKMLERGIRITSYQPVAPRQVWKTGELVILPGGPAYILCTQNENYTPFSYVLKVQRPFSTSPSKPARNMKVILRSTTNAFGTTITQQLTAAIGYPAIGERVFWEIEQYQDMVWGTRVSAGVAVVPARGPNLMADPSFEDDVNGSNPANWITTPVNRAFVLEKYDSFDAKVLDVNILAGTNPHGFRGYLSGNMIAGRTYEFSFYFYRVTGALFNIYLVGGGGGTLTITSSLPNGLVNQWQQATFTFVNDANRTTPFFSFSAFDATALRWWIDGFQCREVL